MSQLHSIESSDPTDVHTPRPSTVDPAGPAAGTPEGELANEVRTGPIAAIRRAARRLFGRDVPKDDDPNIYPLF